MKIATGASETHPTPLPIDTSRQPGVQQPTQVASPVTGQGQIGPTFINTAGVDFTADCAASMSFGMSADADRRAHYAADMTNAGTAEYGDQMAIPAVYDNTLPPASQPGLYGNAGDEPAVG